MSRYARGILALLSLGSLLVSAGAALAADKLECAVYQNGKKTTKLVASKDECTKMNGHIVEPASSKPKTP